MKWAPSVPQPLQETPPTCAKCFGKFPKIMLLIRLCRGHTQMLITCVCSSIVEEGLSYRFHASWPFVMQILGCFYRVAGKKAHPIMTKVFSQNAVITPCEEGKVKVSPDSLRCHRFPGSPCSPWLTCAPPLSSPSVGSWTWLWEELWRAWALKSCSVLFLSTSLVSSKSTERERERHTQWSSLCVIAVV